MKTDEQSYRPVGNPDLLFRATAYAGGPMELVIQNPMASIVAHLGKEDRAQVIALLDRDYVPPPEPPLVPRKTLYLTVSVLAQIGKDHFDVEVLPNGRVEAIEQGGDGLPIRFKLPEGVEPTEALIAEFLTVRREGVRAGERIGAEEVKLSLRALLEVPSQKQVNDRMNRLRVAIEDGDD